MSVASNFTASYIPWDLLRSRGNANDDDRHYLLAPLRLRPYGVGVWFCSSSLQAFTCINTVPILYTCKRLLVFGLHTCYNNLLLHVR